MFYASYLNTHAHTNAHLLLLPRGATMDDFGIYTGHHPYKIFLVPMSLAIQFDTLWWKYAIFHEIFDLFIFTSSDVR